jgi:long-chain acyl-CoA synthetase
MNVCTFLQKSARMEPGLAALIHGDEQISYAEFYSRALAIGGNLLARGLQPGDRVAFWLANSPRVLEVIFGCFSAGLVVVPINARLHARETAYIVSNSGARVLIHGPEYQAGILEHGDEFAGVEQRICLDVAQGASAYVELLDPRARLQSPAEVSPNDPCWLFHTSGTTGRPKGATWTHRSVSAMLMNYLADVQSFQPREVVLHVAPMSHGSGIVALPAVARTTTNIILDSRSFAPREMFRIIEQAKVTHIAFMVPTQIIKMLQEFTPGVYDLSSLRVICYGGAPIYLEHLRNAVKTFGPVFAQIYAQGEAPMTVTCLKPEQHAVFLEANDPRLGSAGVACTNVEVRCVDADDNDVAVGQPGMIAVRGDVVMQGYWNDAGATAGTLRNNWLHTGDIGYLDEHGYLFLLDRSKDMIISGGNNIYTREVEEALVKHPSVATAVVFGIPHEYWGETVHATVVLHLGATVTGEELINFCGRQLASYKKPKSIEFVDSVPVSSYGKVLRRELREKYWQGHASRIGGGAAR